MRRRFIQVVERVRGRTTTPLIERQVYSFDHSQLGAHVARTWEFPEPIVEAIARQAGEMDFAPPFQMGHPLAFELADRLVAMLPAGLERVFYVNSGSEAVDTALKMALAYHRARGEPGRTGFVGRQRGYHGVGFGGMSVGGIETVRGAFSVSSLPAAAVRGD